MILDHIGLSVSDYECSKAFYAATLAAGAQDNGPPANREIYHPHYFGAFAIGPDGHNFETVCHRPPV